MHFTDLYACAVERCEVLANETFGKLSLLHWAKRIGEVRGNEPSLCGCPLGTTCTILEGLDGVIHVLEERDLLSHILVIVCVEEVVNREAL